ncbi:arylamine N-acetyltransferase family protein [Mycolicibacterium komossense]|uniref:Arylamine N-acetyltransferase n=1 Tax=Mycolicibacterium komossense TaxID=1779 RepID=A0ABT3C8B4_9MYCO|nr:arylamine N-acetyltransferase [Mycolicibacterium komossense]MCV7225656.1 arylamine N-acetyltransferase [Mycolicibacterium komossense]
MADLTGYFTRIEYTGPTDPTTDTLAALVTAHGEHIPFENLDPLMGIPVADLSVDALVDKMVRRRRGGYCYEHNGLLGYVLADLGFEVERLTGRVVWRNQVWLDGPPPAETHQVLAVRPPGDSERYLVDVGFGGQTLTSPIRLVADEIQQTRHEPYRLRRYGNGPADGYVLEASIRDEWRALYTFTDQPRLQIDLQLGSWYVSTYPESTFVVGLSASLITAAARWNLRGRNLTVHHRDGPTEKTRLDNAAQVLDVLMNRFGIDVGGIGDVHARITEVLDS